MEASAVPPDRPVASRKTSIGIMAASAVLTLVGLSIIGAISTEAALVALVAGFAALLVRFVWLVWRELE